VALITGAPPDSTYLSCCESTVATNLVSGVLASAPEPASLLYILAGRAALAAIKRTRRRR
jgi:hypothetical protein